MKYQTHLEYLQSHLSRRLPHHGGFAKVTKPLYGYKVGYASSNSKPVRAIINLILPVGTGIFVHRDQLLMMHTRLGRWTRCRKDNLTWVATDDPAPAHYMEYAKLRASRAFVHSIYTHSGKKKPKANSGYDLSFTYTTGKMVYPDSFSKEPFTCRHGIHFFLTLLEAKKYTP